MRSRPLITIVFIVTIFAGCYQNGDSERQFLANIDQVANTKGLVAFWDFNRMEDSIWRSFFDPHTMQRSFPLYLRRIGDASDYSLENWPYKDEASEVIFDLTGPFGKAIRFNKGYIYGAVPRQYFHETLLDLHGHQPFTMIAWVKFIGKRHLIAGIWDEGGWQKYAGRRQVALFAGLFRQKGVIAHVSITGAASFPQSEADGSQYARIRAIDGQPFEDQEWVAVAMTYDPKQNQVTAYLNGRMTPLHLTDPVTQDVFHFPEEQVANPLLFEGPIYAPRAFVLKYNGYNLKNDGVSEHRLVVDLKSGKLTYQREGDLNRVKKRYRINFDISRNGQSIVEEPILMEVKPGQSILLPSEMKPGTGDVVETSLEVFENGAWRMIGTKLEKSLSDGAPFTFGRALGLASEEIEHGSQLYLDGVAVFNRVLTASELKRLSFSE